MVTFEMKIASARIFKINGTKTNTDLTITGNLYPRAHHGTFIPTVVDVRSEKTPEITFNTQAILQLTALFWEAAAYEITQGNFKIGLHYELGVISHMSLAHAEKTNLSLDSLPLWQKGVSGRVLIQELHLFTATEAPVEAVNARFAHPDKLH